MVLAASRASRQTAMHLHEQTNVVSARIDRGGVVPVENDARVAALAVALGWFELRQKVSAYTSKVIT